MKIIPVGKKIQLDIDQPTAGVLDLNSYKSTVEFGTVVAVGPEMVMDKEMSEGVTGPIIAFVDRIKPGDRVFFKSWAVDIITHQEKTYYFIDADSEGICAIVKEDE